MDRRATRGRRLLLRVISTLVRSRYEPWECAGQRQDLELFRVIPETPLKRFEISAVIGAFAVRDVALTAESNDGYRSLIDCPPLVSDDL